MDSFVGASWYLRAPLNHRVIWWLLKNLGTTSCPHAVRASGQVILCMYACTIRMYEFGSEVSIEARTKRIFLQELATVTQPFATLNNHDHDRRTEAIALQTNRAPRGSSLGIFFRFVQ
jgi:hypothetical protein